jgi:hypothetical protein
MSCCSERNGNGEAGEDGPVTLRWRGRSDNGGRHPSRRAMSRRPCASASPDRAGRAFPGSRPRTRLPRHLESR